MPDANEKAGSSGELFITDSSGPKRRSKRQEPTNELFDWSNWRTKLPRLEQHSQAKLDVVRTYIEDYIRILCTGNPGQDRFRLTIVDGFAGGGIYEENKFGSPFVLLQAVQVAEAKLNETRTKKLTIDCHFYFVEKDAAAIECLQHQLRDSVHKHALGKSIFVIQGRFDAVYAQIVEESQRRFYRGGSRVIFFLDQCGYSDAPPPVLRSISESLNWKAEFILNLAIDWVTAYVRSEATLRKIFPALGLEKVLSVEKVIEAVKNPQFDSQYVVESLVGPAFQQVSGSPFFSPFYIQAPKSNRGYWLVHLAPARRARSAMLDVYWRVANGCRHFGHAGLDMLMYKPEASPTGYLTGLEFSEDTRSVALRELVAALPREFRDKHASGISYRGFHDLYCNRVMANEATVREAIIKLMQIGEIEVHGKAGGAKMVDTINPDDVITPGTSPMLIPLVRPPRKRAK